MAIRDSGVVPKATRVVGGSERKSHLQRTSLHVPQLLPILLPNECIYLCLHDMHLGSQVGSGFLMMHLYQFLKMYIRISIVWKYIYIICGMVIHLIWDSRTNGCIMLQYLMTFDDHPWTSPNISKQFGQASCLDLISCHLARTRLAWAVHLPGDLNSATLIYGKTWHWCPSIHCSIILCPKLTEMRIQTLTVCRHTHVMLFVISPIHTPVIN